MEGRKDRGRSVQHNHRENLQNHHQNHSATYVSHWSHLARSKGHWILDLAQYADAFVQIPCRIKCWLSLLAEDLAIGRSSVQTLSPCVAVPRDPNSQGLNLDPTSSCFYCSIIWLSISTAVLSNSHKAWSSWSKMLNRRSPLCFDSQLLFNWRGSTGKVVGGSVTRHTKMWRADNFISLCFCSAQSSILSECCLNFNQLMKHELLIRWPKRSLPYDLWIPNQNQCVAGKCICMKSFKTSWLK